jgi:hypothetical protein
MSSSKLVIRRSAYFELLERCDILAKGGKLPVGTIRTWGGTEYVKAAPGDWRRRVKNVTQEDRNIIDETNTEKDLSDHELKKECFGYARQHFQGKKYLNVATGRIILVSRDGLDEWYNKTKSREQALSIKILDDLLESSNLAKSDVDRKGREDIQGVDYFSRYCVVNGKPYEARITVRTTKEQGTKYYHHYLADIKIEPHSGILRPDETS